MAAEPPTRPAFAERFPVRAAEEAVARAVAQKLQGASYQADAAASLARELSDLCREQLTALLSPRFRVVVQALVAEPKGEGIRFASRALLDESVDRMITYAHRDDAIICSVLAYAVYVY